MISDYIKFTGFVHVCKPTIITNLLAIAKQAATLMFQV